MRDANAQECAGADAGGCKLGTHSLQNRALEVCGAQYALQEMISSTDRVRLLDYERKFDMSATHVAGCKFEYISFACDGSIPCGRAAALVLCMGHHTCQSCEGRVST